MQEQQEDNQPHKKSSAFALLWGEQVVFSNFNDISKTPKEKKILSAAENLVSSQH